MDWRDALPKEPNKLRPAIVVEGSELFDPDYTNVILVPISEDCGLAPPNCPS
jgi:mRNA interferase MazF